LRRSNYDLSTALVAVGAVAVLISLFLDWYEPGLDAFDAFELTDWLLVALAVGALVMIGTEAWSGGGTPSNRLAWICGFLAFLVIAQLLDPPPAARGASREIGAWVALGGSALMVAGAVLALAQISVTIDVTERERRQRMAAVDARSEDASEAPTTAAPSGARSSSSAGLWQAPSAPSAPATRPPSTPGQAPSGPPPSSSRGQAPPPPSTPGPEPKVPPESAVKPADDPQRTQPLKPADRPDGDDAA
jgi:hypothetical protein